MKKEIYKDNNMENNKQAENKEDNLNQFDLDVYAGTIYGTSLPGKDKTKQETLHKKSVGGHRKKDAPSNYSAPPMGMSNRLTVVLQQDLH